MKIPFNVPYLTGKEMLCIKEALESRAHCGNKEFTNRCIKLMRKMYGFGGIFLTSSCTTAMEMGALLANIGPGDEVIMPSYAFSSTANSIVLRGATPVFCEIEPNTMNVDTKHLEKLINKKTKMIIPIDYAGIPCDIDEINSLASKNNIVVMIDSAQSFHSYYKNRPCGTLTDLTAFSFHETKNVTCGEGGALIVNRKDWIERAHFIQEKGTDRKLVLNGVKNKYHWVEKGSSFILADILAAMLFTQIKSVKKIVSERAKITKAYNKLLSPYENAGHISIPHPPKNTKLNHHAYFVIFNTSKHRKQFLVKLRKYGVYPYIGYVPLHSSPMGQKYGYKPNNLPVTESIGSRIVRLPLYTELTGDKLDYCIEKIGKTLSTIYGM